MFVERAGESEDDSLLEVVVATASAMLNSSIDFDILSFDTCRLDRTEVASSGDDLESSSVSVGGACKLKSFPKDSMPSSSDALIFSLTMAILLLKVEEGRVSSSPEF